MRIVNCQVDGIVPSDYPDFCDAYVTYAEWENGTELTETELDELNDDRDFVYSQVMKQLF